jgi:hypothetical protein
VEGSVMREALSILALFSVWNLLILAAVWRVSVRAVDRARREGIAFAASAQAADVVKASRKPRAPKVTS